MNSSKNVEEKEGNLNFEEKKKCFAEFSEKDHI
jgi:hypothetical protein